MHQDLTEGQPFDPQRRRRGGRPVLPASERRDIQLHVRLSPDEQALLEGLKERAAADSLSDYVRMVALNEARAAPRKRQRGPDFGPIVAEFSAIGNNLNQLTRLAHSGHFSPASEAAIKECLQAHGAALRKMFAGDDCPA